MILVHCFATFFIEKQIDSPYNLKAKNQLQPLLPPFYHTAKNSYFIKRDRYCHPCSYQSPIFKSRTEPPIAHTGKRRLIQWIIPGTDTNQHVLHQTLPKKRE